MNPKLFILYINDILLYVLFHQFLILYYLLMIQISFALVTIYMYILYMKLLRVI